MTQVIDPSTTLADLVTRHPDLARELEHRSLDYCCGGQRTLAEACAVRGLDVEETAVALAAAAEVTREAPDWATFGPVELVDHLEATHHAYLHDELPRLTLLTAKVVGVHGDRHPELIEVQRVYGELRDDLEPHLAKEERLLFPMIRDQERHGATPADPIRQMRHEHDLVGELLAELRVAAGGYVAPDDACESYRALYAGLEQLEADTHLHVHKENNLLFPAVLA